MDEKKLVVAYMVKRFDDGSVEVEDAKLEETSPVNNEQIFKDIEDVAGMIKMRRIENSAYSGIRRFYAEIAAQNAATEDGKAE